MKQVVNYIVDTQQLDIDYLVPFQGEAKDLSQKNRYKLRNEIIKTGFSFAFHVWKTGAQYFIIDGHQRLSVLKALRKEGYEVPPMTCNIIKADSIKEAKQRVLQAISQYGKLNRVGLAEFVGEDFDNLTMDDRFDFPDFEFDFDETSQGDTKNSSGEVDLDGFNEFEHECPKCGFGFDGKKKND